MMPKPPAVARTLDETNELSMVEAEAKATRGVEWAQEGRAGRTRGVSA